MAEFKSALVPKGKTIQEQNMKLERDKLLKEWEEQMEDYFDFLETGLNLYEKPCINSWSDNREEVTIQEFLKITKINMLKGFGDMASNILYRNIIEMIDWINGTVAPALRQQARILDDSNGHFESLNEKYKEQLEESLEALNEANEHLKDYDMIKDELSETKRMFKQLFELNVLLQKGDLKRPYDEELGRVWDMVGEVSKDLDKQDEAEEETKEEIKTIEETTKEDESNTNEDVSESDEVSKPVPPNRNMWVKKVGKKK